jgi:hypothetical protein
VLSREIWIRDNDGILHGFYHCCGIALTGSLFPGADVPLALQINQLNNSIAPSFGFPVLSQAEPKGAPNHGNLLPGSVMVRARTVQANAMEIFAVR